MVKEITQQECGRMVAVVNNDEIVCYRCKITKLKPRCHLHASDPGFVEQGRCRFFK
jgi:hypothetical protein